MFRRCKGTLGFDSLKCLLLLLFICAGGAGFHSAEAPRADNLVFCPPVKGFRREQSKAALGEAEGHAELCLTAFQSHCCGLLFVSLFGTGSHVAAQAGLELAMLSPQHPAVRDSAPPKIYIILGGSSF